MIVSCHGCGTRFRHRMPPGAAPDAEATGRCSVCHGTVPLVPARKPYVLVQADLRRVAIGYDDPSLAQEVHRTGRGPIDEGGLRAYKAPAPVAGDLAGPPVDPFGVPATTAGASASPDLGLGFDAATEDAAGPSTEATDAVETAPAGPGAIARLGAVLVPALGLAAAGYHGAPSIDPYLADLPLGAAAPWLHNVWTWTGIGGIVGLCAGWTLLRWKFAKR